MPLVHGLARDRIGCERNADPKYVQQARAKLAKIGYQPPAATPAPQPAEDQGANKTCTIEQITTMVKAGFSDQQIKAACLD